MEGLIFSVEENKNGEFVVSAKIGEVVSYIGPVFDSITSAAEYANKIIEVIKDLGE